MAPSDYKKLLRTNVRSLGGGSPNHRQETFFVQNVLTFIIDFSNRMPTQSSVQTEPLTLIQDENMSVSVLNAHKDITVNLKD